MSKLRELDADKVFPAWPSADKAGILPVATDAGVSHLLRFIYGAPSQGTVGRTFRGSPAEVEPHL